jgi:putative cell wall-binding protein
VGAAAPAGAGNLLGWNSLVVASGSNFPDALSAAGLAGSLNAPIILLPSDGSLPESVREWALIRRATVQANSQAATPFTVYVVGGTAAVPDEGVAALRAVLDAGDPTPTTLVRYGGDNRYETSRLINLAQRANGTRIVLTASETVFLVNGQGFADSLAVAPIAFNLGAPVILTPGNTLGDDARAVLTAYRTLSGLGNGNIVILGGTTAMASAIEDELVGLNFPYRLITRVSGADRYQTAVNLNVWATLNTATQFNASQVALVNGTNFPDGLAAAPVLGYSNGVAGAARHAILTPAGALPAPVTALLTALANPAPAAGRPGPTNIYAIGGETVIPAALIAAVQSTSSAVDTTSSLSCVFGNAAGNFVTLTIPGNASSTTSATGVRGTNEDTLITGARLTINGNANTAVGAATNVVYSATANETTMDIPVQAGALAPAALPGNVIAFTGLTALQNATAGARVIAGSSCTVAPVTTGPAVSVIHASNAAAGGLDERGVIFVEFSKPIASIAAGSISATGGVGNPVGTATSGATATPVNLAQTLWKVTLSSGATAVTVSAGMTITVAAGAATDINGNPGPATAATKVLDASTTDVVAPTLTGTIVCTPQATTSVLNRGPLRLTAQAARGLPGVLGNQYSLTVVNQRGLVVPRVVVDDTAFTIVITADLAYHSVEDVAKAAENSGIANWVISRGSGTGGDAIGVDRATITPVTYLTAGNTRGTQSCVVRLTGNERINNLGSAAATVVVGGVVYGSGLALTAAPDTGSTRFDVAAVAGAGGIPVPVTAGIVTVTLTAGLRDIAGNVSTTALSF